MHPSGHLRPNREVMLSFTPVFIAASAKRNLSGRSDDREGQGFPSLYLTLCCGPPFPPPPLPLSFFSSPFRFTLYLFILTGSLSLSRYSAPSHCNKLMSSPLNCRCHLVFQPRLILKLSPRGPDNPRARLLLLREQGGAPAPGGPTP